MENKFTVKKVEKAENEGKQEPSKSNEATNETVEKQNETVLSGKSTRFTVSTKVSPL